MLGRPGDTAVMPAIDAFYAQHDHELSGTDLTAYAAIALAGTRPPARHRRHHGPHAACHRRPPRSPRTHQPGCPARKRDTMTPRKDPLPPA